MFRSLAILAGTAAIAMVAGSAYAGGIPFTQTIERESVQAHSVDLRNFYPQIDDRYVLYPKRAENPSRPPFMKDETQQNSLAFGGTADYNRINNLAKFPGINGTGWDPPDPAIAVGPNHVVIVVNSSFAIFNKSTGAKLSQQTFQVFNAGLTSESFQFDPKCFYDRISGRFVMVVLEQSDSPEVSKLLIAVSKTNDPTGAWWQYRLESKATINGASTWLDYPGFGYNKDAVVITGNQFGFSSGYQGAQVIVIPKSTAYSGGTVTTTRFVPNGPDGTGNATLGSAFTLQVCETHDNALNKIFMASVHNSANLRIWALENLTTTPTLATTTLTVPSFSFPSINVPVLGGAELDSLDGRLFNAQYRNGSITTAHAVDTTADNRLRARWYEIDVNTWPTSATPTLAQSGEVVGGTDEHMFNPSIAQNSVNDIALCFTKAGPALSPQIMTAGRKVGDAVGVMSTPVVQESSAANYGNFGFNRWGDYSLTTVDPTDDLSFWCVNMNAQANGDWRVSFFKFQVSVPANVQLSNLTINPNTVVSGDSTTGTVTLTAAAPAGGTTVTLTDNTTAIAVPGNVVVPAGSTTANFTITTFELATTATRTVSATLGAVTKTANLTLLAKIKAKTFTIAPASVQSGNSAVGTITLNGAALAGGANVTIASGSSVIIVPASKLIPAGQTSGTFPIDTLVVGSTVARPVTVSYGGVSITKFLTLTQSFNIVSLIASPNVVQGGQSTTGRVTLAGPAPAGGTVVTLQSLSSAIQVPATVTVPAGATFVNFPVTTSPVGAQFVRQIKATRAGVTRFASITLNP